MYRTWKCKKCNLRWESYDCADRLDMFMSEVDHEKYPEVEQKYRFERLCKPKAHTFKIPFIGLEVRFS